MGAVAPHRSSALAKAAARRAAWQASASPRCCPGPGLHGLQQIRGSKKAGSRASLAAQDSECSPGSNPGGSLGAVLSGPGPWWTEALPASLRAIPAPCALAHRPRMSSSGAREKQRRGGHRSPFLLPSGPRPSQCTEGMGVTPA